MLSYKYRLNYPTMTAEIKNKPKGKSRADDTRIDVRFPPSILEAIEQIAEQDGAKIHHISGKRILTPTVIELVKLGLGQVSDKYQLEVSDTRSDYLSGKISDTLTPRVELIEGELADLKKLVTDLSDKISDSLSVTNIIKLSDNSSDRLSDELTESVSDNTPDTLSDINTHLSDNLSDILPGVTPNMLTGKIADMMMDSNDLNLSDDLTDKMSDIKTSPKIKPEGALTISDITEKLGKTRQAIEQRRDSEAGLTDWGYQAERIGRNWYYSPIDPRSK